MRSPVSRSVAIPELGKVAYASLLAQYDAVGVAEEHSMRVVLNLGTGVWFHPMLAVGVMWAGGGGRKATDPRDDQLLWDKTLEEVGEGLAAGPFPPKEFKERRGEQVVPG